MNTELTDKQPMSIGPIDLNRISDEKIQAVLKAELQDYNFQDKIDEIWTDFSEKSNKENFDIMKWLGESLPDVNPELTPDEAKTNALETICYHYILLSIDEDSIGKYKLHDSGSHSMYTEKDDTLSSLREGTAAMVIHLYKNLYEQIYDDPTFANEVKKKANEMRDRMNMNTSSAN